MRRINNWLRCSMTQDRFSKLIVLSAESDIVNDLNIDDLIDKYAKKDNRKMKLI